MQTQNTNYLPAILTILTLPADNVIREGAMLWKV